MLRVLRNVAIVALLALLLTLLPAGDNITDGVFTALTLILFAAIALLVVRFWEQSSLTRDVMTDRQRALFYVALGAIALMIAGTDELFDTGAGTVAWLAIMAVSGWIIFTTWREASSP